MIIKPYNGLPRMYAPDVGEVVEARRAPVNSFVKAVVLDARRNPAGNLRVKVQWLEDDPAAGVPDRGRRRKPIVAGETGTLILVDGALPLIRQIDKSAPSED